MTVEASNVIESFKQLADNQQREVAAEILRQSIHWPLPPLTDEEITSITASAFVEMDREEAADGDTATR